MPGILIDSHVHSHHSGDSDASMEGEILQAIDLGLSGLTFTEHLDYDYPGYPDLPPETFHLDADAYETEFRTLQAKYADRITLRFGLESGMQPCCADRNSRFISSHPFDFVLGSTHLVDGMDPYYPDFFEHRSGQEGLRAYFEATLDNIRQFHDFDVLAHLDYIIRYCPDLNKRYDPSDYMEILSAILEELIRMDKGLELNTGGIRKGVPTTHPPLIVFKRYRELGGKLVTIGSDAHFVEHIAADFDAAAQVLMQAGFTEYAVYDKRIPKICPLG